MHVFRLIYKLVNALTTRRNAPVNYYVRDATVHFADGQTLWCGSALLYYLYVAPLLRQARISGTVPRLSTVSRWENSKIPWKGLAHICTIIFEVTGPWFLICMLTGHFFEFHVSAAVVVAWWYYTSRRSVVVVVVVVQTVDVDVRK
jgi:hypothetical protein